MTSFPSRRRKSVTLSKIKTLQWNKVLPGYTLMTSHIFHCKWFNDKIMGLTCSDLLGGTSLHTFLRISTVCFLQFIFAVLAMWLCCLFGLGLVGRWSFGQQFFIVPRQVKLVNTSANGWTLNKLTVNLSYQYKESNKPCNVSDEQAKRFLCWPAEVLAVDGRHDVRVPIDELHELLQTPEAAFATAQECLQCLW